MKLLNTIDHRGCAIVFVRAPELGMVKTRLARKLREEQVLSLYKSFVADMVAKTQRTADAVRICCYPGLKKKLIVDWLGNDFDYFPQRGKDLGERMAHAFRRTFDQGYPKAILVGTDFPDLPGPVITEAFDALDTVGTVIGPAADGGYYLIGFHRDHYTPRIFSAMPWGTEQVWKKTMAVFEESRCLPHVLPQWWDVDEYADLVDLARRISELPEAAPHTWACLRDIGWL